MPYETPYHLMGWLGPQAALSEFDRLQYNFTPFAIRGQRREAPSWPIWEFAKRINGGQHLPTLKQEIGDCVACGAAQAGMYMACYEIYRLREAEVYKPWFPPFIYGVSRLAPDCGNGRLGNSDGSLGSWGATAMMKYGVLFADDPGVPPYSGRVAKAWGSRPGPPREFYQEASDNRVGSAAKLTTVEEIREALLNYHTITIASQQGFEMQPVRYRDHHVFKPSGQWSHQMSLLAWQDDPFPAAYRLNCYDDQTEVLTDSGWRRFCDLADQDRVATLNPETHMMEFEYPSARQVYPYHGEMIHFHDQGVDLLVTPNHRMYICPEETNVKRPGGTRQTGVFVDRSDPRNWRIELAETCIRRCAFKKDAKWRGQSPEYYQVGEHRVPMGDWLEFVGLYVAEGYRDTGKPRRRKQRAVATAWTADRGINPRQERTSTRRTYRVCLSQVTPEKVEAIQSLLDQLPWRFKRHGTTWVCHSKSLWRELEVCGDGAPNKRLPLYFRQLSAELLQRLYAGLMLGDGTNCRSATGQDTYYTSSRGLADDVQELLLRIGLAGDIYVTDRRGRVVGKGNGVHRELEYAVGVKRKRLTPAKSNGFPKLRIPYSGNVYCVTTANGIIYVRRNGIACWCGQSWGENAHGAPLNGEPPGGAWNHADDLEKELRRYDVELYALSLFDGFDAAPDFSIL